MKKSTVIYLGWAFAMLTFISCKKEYQCDCKVTFSGGSQNDYSQNIYSTEADKQKDCEATVADSQFGKTCTVK